MATASITKSCDVCRGRNIEKDAAHWCPECQEGLCSQCLEYHNTMKATRYHEVISISNYEKIPRFILDLEQHCGEHKLPFQNFCQQHQSLCCSKCIATNHKKCTNSMTTADDVTKTSKKSTLIDHIERTMINIDTNIKMALEDRSHNLQKIQAERARFHKLIKETRDKIDIHLNSLKDTMDQALCEAETKIKMQMENLMEHLNKKKEEKDEIDQCFFAIKNYTSDLQTFIGSKALEEKVNSMESKVKSLFDNDSLNQVSITCMVDKRVTDIFSITSFGTISVDQKKPLISFRTGREQQSQMFTVNQHPRVKSINDIKISLQSRYEIPPDEKNIETSGCTISQNGRIIIPDYLNKRIIIFGENGNTEREINGICAFDVACIDDSTVAVSSIRCVCVLNIDSGKTEKAFKVYHDPYGLRFHRGKLLWFGAGKGISSIDISDGKIMDIVKRDSMGFLCYLEIAYEKIFLVNFEEIAIECFRLNGTKLWEFRGVLLKIPRCITTDNASNIYIASQDLNSVVVLSPDGKSSRRLLGEEMV